MSVQSAKAQYRRNIADPPNGHVTAARAQAAVDIIYADMLTKGASLGDLGGVVIDPTSLQAGQMLMFDGANWVPGSTIDGGGPS